MKKIIYLACPYSHTDPEIREFRFRQVNEAASRLMKMGKIVFSPISHTHPIALAGDLPLGWDYWESFDRAYLEASQEVVVLMLDGWDSSKGVQAEIAIAREMGIPISYLSHNPPPRQPVND